ncbi:MAG: carbohydrate-binding family 9-like protein [Spirochaetales bacterium]|jgi:hypothetical protein|nr:carbohydrate-binding family 9-like protein [Spirochaetales bacterium]
MKMTLWIWLLIVLSQSLHAQLENKNNYWDSKVPAATFNPRSYVCYRTDDSITIDGIPDEESWQSVEWTDEFLDIRGEKFPGPTYSTRAKMLWDDQYFYVAARLEEPHIQGSITQHDAVIFHDNDFEVFIDPSGDTHFYYELEINALNTIWDLLLVKPYRAGGPPINSIESKGIKNAIHIEGTLNDPSDTDSCWYVELAIPLYTLSELNGKKYPKEGHQWRVNFSRVQWHTKVTENTYEKIKDPTTGKNLPEENWVWSPQGVVDMHRPETWGFVQFSEKKAGSGKTNFIFKEEEQIKWALRNIYMAQRKHRAKTGAFAEDAQ